MQLKLNYFVKLGGGGEERKEEKEAKRVGEKEREADREGGTMVTLLFRRQNLV